MSSRHFVLARITEHVEPLERGGRYEDPLTAYLTEHGLGEVTGGGSQLNANGEIEFADVELELVNLDDAITELIQQLGSDGCALRLFDPVCCGSRASTHTIRQIRTADDLPGRDGVAPHRIREP